MSSILFGTKLKFENVTDTILKKSNDGYIIRYNRIFLENWNKLDKITLRALDEWDVFLAKHAFQFKLIPGQLCLFNNKKILHGRTAFPYDEKRLLKRIRFFYGAD